MPKPKKQKPEQLPPSSDPVEDGTVETDVLPEPENGRVEEVEAVETVEEPAKVKYSAEGSPRAVQAAARKIANAPAPPPVATPSNDIPAEDDTDALLADGHNMVVVRRTFPKSVEMQDGSKRRCVTKIPDRYECPTTREKIENDVFDRFGGSEYKCTIHPATTNGETNVLGFFTIEHPNLNEPPYFPDDPPQEPPYDPRTDAHRTSADQTMHETDGLAKLRADAERRLDRARVRKEMKELEAEAKRLEDEIDGTDKKPVAPVVPPVGESDEIRKLREQLASTQAQLAEKKVNDRFDKLEDSIAKLATAVVAGATAKPAAGGEDSIVLKMLNQSQQHAKDMVELMRDKAKPTAPSAEGDLDKFLDRVTKLQTITGSAPGNKGGGTRLSELENKLIDMSFDRLTDGGGGGGDGGDDPEDVAKLAVKEFAPILKTFVEKKMDQADRESGGAPITEEMKRRIYAEAAQAASKKVVEDLAVQGIHLGQAPDGRLVALQPPKPGQKTTVPPRQLGSRVVSEQRTSGGVVKKIAIEPADLSDKPKTHATAPTATEPSKGGEANMAKGGEFPMLGDGGMTLKIPFPIRPGDLKYDRKYAVDFVLDGIRSEIRQGLPQKAATDQRIESYVIGDAIEYLDDEILDRILAIDSGPQLEALLAPWGDAPKIAEIKKAGDDEIVASYLRKLVLSIQREWEREKSAPTQGN
jgi:hypothetical protein